VELLRYLQWKDEIKLCLQEDGWSGSLWEESLGSLVAVQARASNHPEFMS
jgi:hypothetical protein